MEDKNDVEHASYYQSGSMIIGYWFRMNGVNSEQIPSGNLVTIRLCWYNYIALCMFCKRTKVVETIFCLEGKDPICCVCIVSDELFRVFRVVVSARGPSLEGEGSHVTKMGSPLIWIRLMFDRVIIRLNCVL